MKTTRRDFLKRLAAIALTFRQALKAKTDAPPKPSKLKRMLEDERLASAQSEKTFDAFVAGIGRQSAVLLDSYDMAVHKKKPITGGYFVPKKYQDALTRWLKNPKPLVSTTVMGMTEETVGRLASEIEDYKETCDVSLFSGREFYLRKGGRSGAEGTYKDPFGSMLEAMQHIQGGDTVWVYPTGFAESIQIDLDFLSGEGVGKPLGIIGADPAEPDVDSTTTSGFITYAIRG